jgi:hypothetical protein
MHEAPNSAVEDSVALENAQGQRNSLQYMELVLLLRNRPLAAILTGLGRKSF